MKATVIVVVAAATVVAGVVAAAGGMGVVNEIPVLVLDADASVGVAGFLATIRKKDLNGSIGVFPPLKLKKKKKNV